VSPRADHLPSPESTGRWRVSTRIKSGGNEAVLEPPLPSSRAATDPHVVTSAQAGFDAVSLTEPVIGYAKPFSIRGRVVTRSE
jgi:hypothetical protein